MKLFLDENLSSQHAAELRTEGYDAVAVFDVGLSGAGFRQQQTVGVVRLKVHPATAGLAVVDDDKIRIRG